MDAISFGVWLSFISAMLMLMCMDSGRLCTDTINKHSNNDDGSFDNELIEKRDVEQNQAVVKDANN